MATQIVSVGKIVATKVVATPQNDATAPGKSFVPQRDDEEEEEDEDFDEEEEEGESDSDCVLMTKKRKVSNFDKVHVGAYVNRMLYGKIVGVSGTSVSIEDEYGVRRTVCKETLEENFFVTGRLFDAVRSVTVDELANIIRNDVREKVIALTYTKGSTKARKGQTYTLRSTYIRSFSEKGFMCVFDLECQLERTVNIKTVASLDLGVISYVVHT
jgi:hypothetical protein